MRHLSARLSLLLAALLARPAAAVLLYDASSGLAPTDGAWGWGYGQTSSVGRGVTGGAYRLDTTASEGISAGFFKNFLVYGGPVLDTASGYELGLRLRVNAETHGGSDQRAGFSFIAVGSDVTRAIEVAFWEDSVWAYTLNAGNQFVRGPQASVATTAGFADYLLRVQDQRFDLLMDGSLLFGGDLVDYTPANTSVLGIDPYAIPNFLFWGDDTSSAQSSVDVARISFEALTPAAAPAPTSLWLLLTGLAVVARRRLSTPDDPAS
jgi:hypothetical protein